MNITESEKLSKEEFVEQLLDQTNKMISAKSKQWAEKSTGFRPSESETIDSPIYLVLKQNEN